MQSHTEASAVEEKNQTSYSALPAAFIAYFSTEKCELSLLRGYLQGCFCRSVSNAFTLHSLLRIYRQRCGDNN
jgi:hypothetical protein